MVASSSNNPFARMLDTNKLRGAENFADWDLDLRIVLNSEKLGCVFEGPLPLAVADDATPEEIETLRKWRDDDSKVKSYILSSLVPELKRQYFDLLDAFSMISQLRELFMNQE